LWQLLSFAVCSLTRENPRQKNNTNTAQNRDSAFAARKQEAVGNIDLSRAETRKNFQMDRAITRSQTSDVAAPSNLIIAGALGEWNCSRPLQSIAACGKWNWQLVGSVREFTAERWL
jgi:hypothetical protein